MRARITRFLRRCVLGALTLLLMPQPLAVAGAGAAASPSVRRPYALPPGDAAEILRRFADESGYQIVFLTDVVRGVETQAVAGELSAREALDRLLAGTPLAVSEDTATGALMIYRPAPARPPAAPRAAKRAGLLAALGGWLALGLAPGHAARAADGSPVAPAASAAVSGRVQNFATGQFLNNARVAVRGTDLVAFTDQSGTYRLPAVPPGKVVLEVFYTGLDPQSAPLNLAVGQPAVRDFDLTSAARYGEGGVVKLDAFTVATSREIDGQAIAINEQRFASNMKSVVSTEEYGNIAEGNIAEFLKFVPGVAVGYTGGNAREISINGTPSANVPISVDGFSLASASVDTNASRAVQVDMLSLNSLARIEVSYSPTPETPGGALAGSVNLVPRNSFERARPVINSSLYVLMRDNARDFRRGPGPKPYPTSNVHPGFDFSWINPVSRRFGYTLSLGQSAQLSPQDLTQLSWRGTQLATNGAAFPHTTPERPYLTSYAFGDSPKVTTRNSAGLTLDARLGRHDTVTFGLQYSSFTVDFLSTIMTFNVGRVLADGFSLQETRGAARGGDIQVASVQRHRVNRTLMPTLVWRHHGPVWKSDLGLGLSLQNDKNPDASRGFFRNVTSRRSDLTVSFLDLQPTRPRTIQVLDGATGQPVDPHALSTYTIGSGTLDDRRIEDEQRTAYANVTRDLRGRWPLTLKAGLDLRQSRRDGRGGQQTINYVGADGRASTVPGAGDDHALPFLDPVFSQRTPPYGFPRTDTVSTGAVYRHYLANPSHFTSDANASYRSAVNFSRYSEELISSAYLRADAAFLDQRLKLVGGLRAEQTNIDALGPLTDPTRNYQRRADGTFVLGANGRPVPLSADPLQVSRATFIERGSTVAKEYLRLFPSLNASYTLRENWIARAAHYYSVGRPNFDQYTGALTLPDTDRPSGPGNFIVVNNAAIKAWSARTTSIRLERYFEGVGLISVSAFRRDIRDFFDTTIVPATPAFLAVYELNPALYGNYEVNTQQNVAGTVRMTGVDLSYKQAITFLPHWARGLQVFANASTQRATGENAANFAGYVPRTGSWGVSLTRERFNVRANWNYRSEQRLGRIAAGASIGPSTYTWSPSRLYLDVSGEFNLTARLALFAALRNVTDQSDARDIYGPTTPASARFRQSVAYASLWTFGVKGQF